MQIQITGRHVDITKAIDEFVRSKFEKLERHFDHITQVHVIISVEKTRHIAEAEIHVTGGNLFAQSESENMYAAIDLLIDKLDRQIVKHKEKLRHRNNTKTEV